MQDVFLCYRRGDAADVVGRIGDRLNRTFGEDFVFRDVDDIMPAANFRVAIDDALSEVQCVLVAIGPDWLDSRSSDGSRRLDQPDDPVRTEIETAMSRHIPIIPLLVRGAAMPPKSALPGSIATLPDLNGLPIRPDPDFDHDVERLVGAIAQIRGDSPRSRESGGGPPAPGLPRKRLLQGAGVLAVVAVIAILAMMALRAPIVPNLVGLNELQAGDILSAAGIDITVRVEASEQEQGRVIGQDPESGSRARSVELVISEGQRSVVPDLTGRVGSEAAAEMSNRGFTVDISEEPADQPAGVVVRQFPEAGVESAAILLFVSSGPAPQLPEIPELVGLNETDARNAVPSEVAVTVDLIEDAAAAGTVIAQNPGAGARSLELTIEVSAGPGLPVLPTLVGLPEGDVTSQLAELGIAVAGIDRQSSPLAQGVVVSQTPDAGTRTDQVSLVVSSGPGPAEFAATWENVDETTGGMTRLVIGAGAGNTVSIRGFGSCSPRDCDWGEITGTVANAAVTGRYDFGWKTTAIEAELAGDFLVVSVFDDYAEGDARSDRTSQYVMTRDRSLNLNADAIANALEIRPDLSDLFRVQTTLAPLIPTESLIIRQLP